MVADFTWWSQSVIAVKNYVILSQNSQKNVKKKNNSNNTLKHGQINSTQNLPFLENFN